MEDETKWPLGSAAPWNEHESARWMQAVISGDPSPTVTKLYVRYKGDCLRCGHEITVDIPRPLDSVDIGAFDVEEDADAAKKADVTWDGRSSCNCTEGHDPSHPKGCGVYGRAYL
jgi:hypothetical protein